MATQTLDLTTLLPAIHAGLERCQRGLSGLTGETVTLTGEGAEIRALSEVPRLVTEREEVVVALYLSFHGALTGHCLLVFDRASATWLSRRLLGNGVGFRDTVSLDPMAASSLAEMGNVTVSSFLNGMADSLEVAILPSPVHMAVDYLPAILQSLLAALAVSGDAALVVSTRLSFPAGDGVHGYLLLVPDVPGLMAAAAAREGRC